MGIRYLKNWIWALPILFSFYAQAQQKPNTDCRTAKVICSDSTFTFLPLGRGIDDFANPKNGQGCLQRRENVSSWFYFEFRKDMPPNSQVWFKIVDQVDANCFQDFDFAIFPGQLHCDSLGNPIRCSFFQPPLIGAGTLETGMRPAAQDTTEGLTGDGFLKPMTVQPGQGYFLLVDFFVGVCFPTFDSTRVQDFLFDWDGPAAPFLNCIANPNCDLVQLTTSRDTTVCAGSTVNLSGSATFTNGGETYIWRAKGAGASFIQPQGRTGAVVNIPLSFSGRLVYEFTVEEGNCVHSDSVVINVRPAPNLRLSADTLLCPNATTTVNAPGGFATYRWQNGNQTSSLPNVGPGTYRLSVTTNDGCRGEASIQIRQKNAPNPLITGDTILCIGENTRLSVVDTFATYLWSNTSTSNSILVNQAGTYTVQVSDRAGCRIQGSKIVVIKDNPPASIGGASFFCQNSSTILVGPNGTGLTYRWSPSNQTTRDIEVRAAGNIGLTVTNEFGCTASSSIVITERSNPAIQVRGDRLFCGNSSAILFADPGFRTYQWSTGSNNDSIRIFQPGTYQVSVTDGFGCQGVASATIDTLPYPRPQIMGRERVCSGEMATLTPGVYQSYRWSTGATSSSIPVTTPGVYRVTVTAANGCIGSDSIPVQVFPSPTPDIQGDMVLCPGERTTLNLSSNYVTYAWSTGSTSATVIISQAGPVTVRVVDVNGCSGRDSISVSQVSRPRPSIQGLTQLCTGDTAMLSGGLGYQRYRWSTGDTLPEISIIRGGLFSLTVTDFNNCIGDTSLNVQFLSNPKPSITGDRAICDGTRANLTATPGYASYAWSDGQITPSIAVNTPGLYIVSATSANGCVNQDSIDLRLVTPKFPQGRGMEKILCRGTTLILDAGSGFNSYRWSTGATTQAIQVGIGGRYEISVIDSNGCATSSFYPVISVSIDTPSISGPNELCEGQSALLFALNGRFRSYQWSTGESTGAITVRQGGNYSLNTVDQNGCRASAQKSIVGKPAPPINITGDLVICRNETTILTASPGYNRYLWTNSNNDTARSITVAAAGPYSVQVFGANGCPGSATVRVVQSRLPFPIIDGDRFLCEKDTLVLEVESGFAFYQWSNGESDNSIVIREPGMYGVLVRDSLNCEGNALITVFPKTAPPVEIVAPREFCPGDTVTLRTTTRFVGYEWPNGDTSATYRVNSPGTYRVRVEGANGCFNQDTFLLRQSPVPSFSFNGKPFFCEGSSTDIVVTPGYEQYNWRDGVQGAERTFAAPGTYYLQVRNVQGCLKADSLNIQRIALPIANAGPDSVLTCIRRELNLGGSTTSDGRYTWVGPSITLTSRTQRSPRVNQPGWYTLLVTDPRYGCISATDSVEILDLAYQPSLGITPDGVLNCLVDSMRLRGVSSLLGGRYQYQWVDGFGQDIPDAQTIDLLIRSGGKYTLQLIDTRTGCIGEATYTAVPDTLRPVADIYGGEALTCVRDSVTLSVTQARPNETWTYQWDLNRAGVRQNLSARPRLTLGQTGWYRLRVRNEGNGCIALDSIQILRDTLAPNADAGPDQELDCTNTQVQIGRSGQSNASFRWYQIENSLFNRKEAQPSVDEAGTYILEVENLRNGCRRTDTVRVLLFNNSPDSLDLAVKHVTCAGLNNGELRVLNVRGGEGPFLYRLGRQGAFGTNTTFTRLPDGAYTLAVQDIRGCEWNQVVNINPGVAAELQVTPPQSIKRGETVRLQAVTNLLTNTVENFRWNSPTPGAKLACDTCRDFRIQLFKTTEFKAAIVDTNGCTDTAYTLVVVDPNPGFYVPNAFSPDGDGINDFFDIKVGRDIETVSVFQVYDRWGNLMYNRRNFDPRIENHGWDGMHRGQKKESAVFAWYIEVIGVDGERFFKEGGVHLIR
jgi:gliding motility-associated-like protein